MLREVKRVINLIKEKEENGLVVLKGFNQEVFEELNKEFDSAFMPEFYKEENVLETLVENKKKLQKRLMGLDEGIYLAQYEELLVVSKNLGLYDYKVFILENNLFDYYQYNFSDVDKVREVIRKRESEIINSQEDDVYEQFYSDIVSTDKNVFVIYKDLSNDGNVDGTVVKNIKVFSTVEYAPSNVGNIDEELENVEVFSGSNIIKNQELKYKIVNGEIKDKLNLLLDKNALRKSKFKGELGVVKYLCDIFSITLNFYLREDKKIKEYRKDIVEILKRYWNSDKFRELKFYSNPDISLEKEVISQGEIIEEILQKVESSKQGKFYKNLFITAPTGAGKSIFFQIPALYLAEKYNYVTLVISPLKALMKDQIENLKSRGVDTACFLNSDLAFSEKNRLIEEIKSGEKSIVYLSPELLQMNSNISDIIGDREIGMIVLDEAHTVSTWGKNFRIDYLLIGNYIKKIEQQKKYKFPILALTATAVYGGECDTVGEIEKSLQAELFDYHIGEVRKDNIKFDIKHFDNQQGSYRFLKNEKTKERIAEKIKEDKKTIFYFPYAKQTGDIYSVLDSKSRSHVAHYTGKKGAEERAIAQHEFKTNEKKIMLATKAFGMGVDIPDIEHVYHYGLGGDLADYVQEIGRCARDKNIVGVAEIDFNRGDLKFSKILRSISGVKQWQMKLVMEKLFELYKLNNYKSSFLCSIESFSHIFTEKEQELEKKVKQALLFLEKDLYAKYTFPVVIARPKVFFSSLYVVIRRENEKDILTEKNKKYFEKILDQAQNIRHIKEYDFKGNEIPSVKYDTGDIYEFKIAKYWEENYADMSYPLFIRDFFMGKIFNEDYISNRIKLKVEIKDTPQKTFAEVEYYLEAIFKALTQMTGYFTKEELEEKLAEILMSNNKIFIKKLTNIILTYSFKASGNTYVDNGDKFLRVKKDLETTEEKFILVRGNFSKYKSKIIRGFCDMFDRNGEENTFIRYIVKDSKIVEVATLLQTLELGSFEVSGGNTPKIFIRLNDPAKLEYLSKSKQYSNSILSNIEKVGKKSDKILEEFFTRQMTDEERWDYIENYFLGRN